MTRLIRFQSCSPSGMVREGILSAFRKGLAVLEDAEKDSSQMVTDSFVAAVKDFCTPLGGEMDVQLYEHMVQSILTFGADGAAAAQKALRLVRSSFPRLVLLLRDPSHAIRASLSFQNMGLSSSTCLPTCLA